MAHHTAKKEFDHVAFDRYEDGHLKWTYTPRTVATAKAKAKREGYASFYTATSDHARGWITDTMKIRCYIFDPDAGKWIVLN